VQEIVSIAKALSDENRVRALMLLSGRELCVCRIVEFLKLAPSTVSKHMSILKAAGLVVSRKDEKWMHYKLAQKEGSSAIRDILDWLSKHMSGEVTKSTCCGRSIPKNIRENICAKTKN